MAQVTRPARVSAGNNADGEVTQDTGAHVAFTRNVADWPCLRESGHAAPDHARCGEEDVTRDDT